MTGRAQSERAYILHSRAFRETSLLLDVITPEHGRVTGLSRGARAFKRSQPAARPFVCYSVSWSGRGEIVNLGRLEPLHAHVFADTRRTLCALYMNELMVRLTTRGNPSMGLFSLYEQGLATLAQEHAFEPTLRRFEAELLHTLGYGVHIDDRDSSGAEIDPGAAYDYDVETGMVHRTSMQRHSSISGRTLGCLKRADFADPDAARELKHFFRRVLDHHLQGRTVYARKIMQHLV